MKISESRLRNLIKSVIRESNSEKEYEEYWNKNSQGGSEEEYEEHWNKNSHGGPTSFYFSTFILKGAPSSEDDLLSDMCDAYEMLDFMSANPDCGIKLSKNRDGMNYSAYVDYVDYRNWSSKMKNYWRMR
jgi:hypothetical protein